MYVYVYVYSYMYMGMCMCICICIYVCVSVYIFMYLHSKLLTYIVFEYLFILFSCFLVLNVGYLLLISSILYFSLCYFNA